MLTAAGLLGVGCVAVLRTALVVVLIVVILVLVTLLTAVVIVAILLMLTALLAVIVTSACVLAIHRAPGAMWQYALFVVVRVAVLTLLLVLGTVGIVMVLAILVIVIVGVLALLALGVALSLAVAVVVLASLWMSGHRGKLLALGCRVCVGKLSITVAPGAANAETAGVRGAGVPQTMGIRSGRGQLLVVELPRVTWRWWVHADASVVMERVCCGERRGQ